MAVNIVGLKRSCQKLKNGGTKRIWLLNSMDIEEEFLNYKNILQLGCFSGTVPFRNGAYLIEIEAWYDTGQFGTEMSIGAGFAQSFQFKVLGYNQDILAFTALLNSFPANVIVEGNNNEKFWIGTKYLPMFFEQKGNLPDSGLGRKEVEYAAKRDGMTIPIIPVDNLVFSSAPDLSFEQFANLSKREFDLSFDLSFG
tara:strand:- start:205 stop:795 length:591 start_codon:yes stop_codon:yes gene_type:complete